MRPRGWVARSCVDGKLKIKPCNAAIDKAKKSVGTFSFDYCTLKSMGFHLTVFWDLKWICSTPSLPKDQADLVYRTCGEFFPKAFCVPSCLVLVCWDLCLGSWNHFFLGFDWGLWCCHCKIWLCSSFYLQGQRLTTPSLFLISLGWCHDAVSPLDSRLYRNGHTSVPKIHGAVCRCRRSTFSCNLVTIFFLHFAFINYVKTCQEIVEVWGCLSLRVPFLKLFAARRWRRQCKKPVNKWSTISRKALPVGTMESARNKLQNTKLATTHIDFVLCSLGVRKFGGWCIFAISYGFWWLGELGEDHDVSADEKAQASHSRGGFCSFDHTDIPAGAMFCCTVSRQYEGEFSSFLQCVLQVAQVLRDSDSAWSSV